MSELQDLANETRRLRRIVRVQGLALALALTLGVLSVSGRGHADSSESDGPERVTVSELAVVDERGVVRVRVTGEAPDAVIDGTTIERGSDAAGVILYDRHGQERGGYVTWDRDDNVGLTLDTRTRQVALLAAGPDEGAVVRIWHDEDSIALRSDSGGSRLTAVRDGRVVFQEPALDDVPQDACDAYRAHRDAAPIEEIVAACRQRFPDAACRACLER